MIKAHRKSSVLIAAILGLLGVTSTAAAGTYDVLACGGGANYTWHKQVNHGGMTAYPDAPGCDGNGLVARHVGQPNGWTVPFGSAARWFFYAPPGAAVVGVAMKARFDRRDGRWQAALSNGSTILRGCRPGNETCADDLNGDYFDIPPSSTVYTEAYCPSSSCPAYWQQDGYFGNVFARAIIYAATMRIADFSPPAVAGGRGPAWTSEWIGGMRDVSFDSSDNTGIAMVSVAIDGTESSRHTRSCDPYALTCPDWSNATLEVNTRAVTDGAHRLTVAAVDRAGNVGSAAHDIRVDNTPPSAPTGLAASGGAWRAKPGVRLTWTNPSQEHSPIVGAVVEACPVGVEAACVTRDHSAAGIASAELDLPKPGSWDVRVFLRDAAGNALRENASPAVRLGFDPHPPQSVGFRPLEPDNPARIRVQASDDLSGLAGGEIQIRHGASDSWRSLVTAPEDGGFTATLPDAELRDGRYLLRARVWDAAGNERSADTRSDGSRAELMLPVRVKTRMLVGRTKRVRARSSRGRRRTRTIYVRRPLVRHARRARLSGRLLAPGGNALAGVAVEISARADTVGAAFVPVATLTTSRTGRFSYLLPAGASRIVRFHYGGAPKIRPQTRDVYLRVRAWSTLRASHRHIVTGMPVTFRGRVRTTPLPATGKLVELQYYDRGSWRTFRTARAAVSDGRWSYTYRFTGTTGRRTYRFRARVPRESGYPYAPGKSRPVRLTVQGL